MFDFIEKTLQLAAPIDRVWSAITDVDQFNSWFRVKLAQPFAPGTHSRGPIAEPGYEHLDMVIMIETMEEPTLFAFRWHPHAVDLDKDYSAEPTTLVEFRLTPEGAGTRLTITESGFEAIPAERREQAWRSNDEGWAIQAGRIAAHVGG